jgi:hypothetical protein
VTIIVVAIGIALLLVVLAWLIQRISFWKWRFESQRAYNQAILRGRELSGRESVPGNERREGDSPESSYITPRPESPA